MMLLTGALESPKSVGTYAHTIFNVEQILLQINYMNKEPDLKVPKILFTNFRWTMDVCWW